MNGRRRRPGGGQKSEMGLWKKAEVEVHGQPARRRPRPAAPRRNMASTSPVFFATDRNDEGTLGLRDAVSARRRLDPFEYTCGFLGARRPPLRRAETAAGAEGADQGPGGLRKADRRPGREGQRAQENDLFVIHGFNTPFDGLAWRALQVGSDLDYDGTIVGWSWPSEGSAFGYAYDEDSSAWSEPHLVDLVSEIAAAGPEMQLDFVAHSMGNRILLQMLRELAQARSTLRIGAAIFAAPDVAQDVFRERSA